MGIKWEIKQLEKPYRCREVQGCDRTVSLCLAANLRAKGEIQQAEAALL